MFHFHSVWLVDFMPRIGTFLCAAQNHFTSLCMSICFAPRIGTFLCAVQNHFTFLCISICFGPRIGTFLSAAQNHVTSLCMSICFWAAHRNVPTRGTKSHFPVNIICYLVANINTYFHRDGPTIGLNFETLSKLHTLLSEGYDDFVSQAPADWKKDGFLLNNKPIMITSRYGQNASIALEDNQDQEANDWNSERDYSKIAFLTFALATSIELVFTFIHNPFLPRILHFL